MSRLGHLTEDEKARYEALTFRMCKEDHWDVSACDCPADCEHVQETEVKVQVAVEKIWGEGEMETRLATEWEIRPPSPKPPPLLGIQTVSLRHAGRGTVASNGTVCLWDIDTDTDIIRCVDIRWLIASLEGILVLAKEHFGEDWGEGEGD